MNFLRSEGQEKRIGITYIHKAMDKTKAHAIISDNNKNPDWRVDKMAYTLSEKRVLRRLGIPDFRHMKRDKIVKFVSMLPYMDPEVAKKALEQFPSFKELAGDIVTQYSTIIDKAFEENRISQQAFYDVCKSILESLQKELEDDDIDATERARIEDKMIQVANMIGEKDRENKGMILKTVGLVSGVFLLILGGAAALLGSNTHYSNEDGQLANPDEPIDM